MFRYALTAVIAAAIACMVWEKREVQSGTASFQPRAGSGAAGGIPGAVGDARHDDTPALQRALDRGGVVDLGRGTYRITRPLVIDLSRTGPSITRVAVP